MADIMTFQGVIVRMLPLFYQTWQQPLSHFALSTQSLKLNLLKHEQEELRLCF